MGFELTKKRIVAIAAVVIVVAAALVIIYDFNGKSLDLTDREVRIIPTNSMDGEPRTEYEIQTIPQWSLVMIHLLKTDEQKESVKVGDVITFNSKSSGLLTVHRIIDITDGVITTQGDNKSSQDYPTITYSEVLGVVVGVSPWMGQITHFIQSSSVLLLLIIAVLIVMVWVIFDIVKIVKHNKQ